ncbi:hypothetical protein MTO96_032176, partial [Rhipicephalus appendiculatus]
MKTAVRICDALLYAVLMAVLHFGHCGNSDLPHKEEEKISEFYSQHAKITTLYSTIVEEVCKVDEVTTTTKKYTDFKRTFFFSLKSLQLEGTFIMSRYYHRDIPFSSMDVRQKNGMSDYHTYERLFYTFDQKKCGVFFISKQKDRG